MKRVFTLFVVCFIFAGCASGEKLLFAGWSFEDKIRFDDAWELHLEGKYEEAGRIYKELLRKYEKSCLVHNNLSDIYVRSGDLLNAELHIEDAIRLNDKEPKYQHQKGRLMLLGKEYDEAIGAFSRAIALAPNEPLFRYSLGKAYEVKGNMIDAEREIRSAYNLDEKHELSLRWLAKKMIEDGRFLEAQRYLRTLLEINPDDNDLYFDAASCLVQARRYDAAVSTMKYYLEHFKNKRPESEEVAKKFVDKFLKIVEDLANLEKIKQAGSDVDKEEKGFYEDMENLLREYAPKKSDDGGRKSAESEQEAGEGELEKKAPVSLEDLKKQKDGN